MEANMGPSRKSSFEPGQSEVLIQSLCSPLLERIYYREFVRKLGLKGNEKVIDYGSGAGSCAKYLVAELSGNGQLTCIDISKRWLAIANRRLKAYKNVKFLQGQIADLNLEPAAFDLIVIHFVIHDIPKQDRKEIIDCLRQALRLRGKLVIREPLNEKHGIQAEELHNLLAGCGLRRISLKTERFRFVGNVAEGIYENIE